MRMPTGWSSAAANLSCCRSESGGDSGHLYLQSFRIGIDTSMLKHMIQAAVCGTSAVEIAFGVGSPQTRKLMRRVVDEHGPITG